MNVQEQIARTELERRRAVEAEQQRIAAENANLETIKRADQQLDQLRRVQAGEQLNAQIASAADIKRACEASTVACFDALNAALGVLLSQGLPAFKQATAAWDAHERALMRAVDTHVAATTQPDTRWANEQPMTSARGDMMQAAQDYHWQARRAVINTLPAPPTIPYAKVIEWIKGAQTPDERAIREGIAKALMPNGDWSPGGDYSAAAVTSAASARIRR